MKKNKLWLIVIPLVLVAVALIGTAGYLILQQQPADEYSSYIALAEEKFGERDYDGAIEAYEKAIALDAKKSTAYKGLIEVYLELNQPGKIETILKQYEEQTDDTSLRNRYSDKLQALIDGLGENSSTEESSDSIDEVYEKPSDADTEISLNTSLLEFLSGASYSDYKSTYGDATIETSGNTSVLTYPTAGFVCTYAPDNGQVLVGNDGKPYSSSYPTSIEMTDLSLLLPGLTGETTLEKLEESGAVTDAKIEESGSSYYLTFAANNCSIRIACDADGTISGPDAWNEITILQVAEEADVCEMSGRIKDATTGGGVPNAQLRFRSGLDNTTGSVVAETSADSYGDYIVELEHGEYTMEISATGYITEYITVEIYSWLTSDEVDLVISPELAAGEIRVVLEWGATPRDLDSHLIGTSSSGKSVHVYFGSSFYEGIAELDVDEMHGYGPETTTIYDIYGDYDFVINDYGRTGTMAQSGATVKIYMPGQSQPTVLSVPASVDNEWYVFSLSGGQIEIKNVPYD